MHKVIIKDKDTGLMHKTYESMDDAEADRVSWERMYPNAILVNTEEVQSEDPSTRDSTKIDKE